MPEEKKTPTTTPPGESAKEYAPTTPTIPPGQVKKEPAPNQDLPEQEQQDITSEQQDPTTQDQTRLTDLELKEMNTLTALDEPTEEQKKRLNTLQSKLPKNPAKIRSKQRT